MDADLPQYGDKIAARLQQPQLMIMEMTESEEAMLTPRQNAEAILNREQPDYYGDFMDTLALTLDPVFLLDHPSSPTTTQADGAEGELSVDDAIKAPPKTPEIIWQDSWGVTFKKGDDAPGPHPLATPESIVIKDITHWQDYVHFPEIDNLDWTECVKKSEAVDRTEKYLAAFSAGGLFERSHHLMGFENALIAYMDEPDHVGGLLDGIMEWKIKLIRLLGKYMKPDVIFFHDDWGMKRNLLLPPNLWREIIKPRHAQIVAAAHDEGIFFLHHADCFCQPIVTDMVDIGIDAWQGVIAQNDIVEIQRITEGKLAMVGGIDGPAIDTPFTTEDDIRAEVRRCLDSYCPAGRFFPSIPNGMLFTPGKYEVFKDEMGKYGRQWAEEHPIKK
jgi:hypothetical protein